VKAAPVEFILQCLLQGIANGALAVSAANIQGHLVHAFDFMGDLGAPQDKTNLRPVAMPDDHIPAGFEHIGDVECRFAGRLILVFHRLVVFIFDQGISADGDDC
jgi:hypothetical protein